MTPIVPVDQALRLPEPVAIIRMIDSLHPAAQMLVFMCRGHPSIYSRARLIQAGGMAAQGSLCSITAFHFRILRINDHLPFVGWRIDDENRLMQIPHSHTTALRERLQSRNQA